jgi:hypothetical protein
MVLMRGEREGNTYTTVTYKYTKAKRGNPEQQATQMNRGNGEEEVTSLL